MVYDVADWVAVGVPERVQSELLSTRPVGKEVVAVQDVIVPE